LRHAKPASNLRVGRSTRRPRLKILQEIEKGAASAFHVLLPQPVQRHLKNGLSPAPFENLIGGKMVRRFGQIRTFLGHLLQRERRSSPSAFLGAGLTALLLQKMLQQGQHEGAKFAALMPQMLEILALDEFQKKLLRQILGFSLLATFTSNEGIKRRPVGAAQ